MPNARRQWSDLRSEIRRLLRETTAAQSYWSDQDLLDIMNRAIVERYLDMVNADEGWSKGIFETDLVAQQEAYALPEGITRVIRVLRVETNNSGGTTLIPLKRNEHSVSATWDPSSLTSQAYVPDYRLVGDNIILTPSPGENITNGLRVEVEFAPARLTGDTSTLPAAWPTDALETLLVYDVWDAALGVEDAMQAQSQNSPAVDRLQARRMRLEANFLQAIEPRTESVVITEGFYLGD